MNNSRQDGPRQGSTLPESLHQPHSPAHDGQMFDQAMRDRYNASLSRLPSGTHARLRAARHAVSLQSGVPTGMGASRGTGLKWAGAFAAMFGLALVLQLSSAPAPVDTTPSVSATAATDTPYDAESTVAVLEENPDLYLWLAANDDALRPFQEQ